MNRFVYLLIGFCSINFFTLQAQVAPPCPSPPPPGGESCPQACVYCDFDGYMGNNNGTASGGNTVCNQITLHNDQWFGFVAGTTSISIDILTSNCQDGNGLQAAFFAACDEDAITCNPGVGGGAGIPLTLTYDNFVPGQTYFLMVDGWTGDVCDFEIDVTLGDVTPPPPSAPAQPQGPNHVCPGATVVYSIPDAAGAGYYMWTAPPGSNINGSGLNNLTLPAPDGTSVTITFGSQGGNVCVKAGNACFPALQACLPVINQPIPPTILPPMVLCYGDVPFVWDEEPHNILNVPGTFTLTSTPYDSYLGCDSTVKQTIIVKDQIKTNIGTKYVCQGECFIINNNSYCTTGQGQEIFDSYQGCDSLVQFNLIVIPNTAVIQPTGIIDCITTSQTLNSNGSSNGQFNWTNSSWTTIGTQATQVVTGGGTYHLILSSQLGGVTCRDTATIDVTANNTPPGVNATGGVIGCLATNQSVTLQASSVPGVNYQWTGPGITPANQNLQNPTVTTPGTYIVTVTNPVSHCTSTASASVVTDNTPPSAMATGGVITCALPTVTLDGATNVPNASFNWTGPGINAGNQSMQDPPVSVQGAYAVTVTNNVNGCTSTATATVTQNIAVPTADAGANQTLSCVQTSVTLSGAGNAGGAPLTYTWSGPDIDSTNMNAQSPSVDLVGNYILTVTNTQNGCIKTDTAVVNANTTAPTASAGPDLTLTCAATTLTLNGSGSSQGANFQASWAGIDITPANQNQYSPSISQPGTYTLTILNTQNGCTATDQAVVGVNVTLPSADAGTDQLLTCTSNNGVILSGGGMPAGITFLWTGPGIGVNNNTQQNPSVTLPGSYTLQVTDPVNGCTATDQVDVALDASVPVANAGPDLVLNCTVNSVNLDGGSSSSGVDFVYLWTGPGITPANSTVQSPNNISAAGTYSLTVTNNANGCSNTDIVVISLDTLAPTASAGQDLVLNCYNQATDTLDASGSDLGASFTLSWSGPDINAGNANAQQPVITQPGMYNLTVTNTANTCTATDQAMVSTDMLAPTADAGADKIIDCVTTSTAIGGNSSAGANFTYVWAGPGISAANETQATPVIALQGNYSLIVTNTVNGCTAMDDATVTLNATYPTALAGPDQVATCAQPDIVLDGSASSNGATFQITWTGPGITPGNANQVSPTVNTAGMYVISITDTGNSCSAQDTVFVTEDKIAPTADAGADQLLDCQSIEATLDGNLSSFGPNFIYLWSGSGITPATEDDQNPLVNQPGAYTLLVTNTDNGCTQEDFVSVTQDIAAPIADAGAGITLTCAQNSLSLDGSASSTGAGFSYVWQGPGINTNNFSLQNPAVADSGTYVLLVTNLQNHCTATDEVYVALDAQAPTAEAGADQTLTCTVVSLSLDGSQSQPSSNISYLWSGPDITPANETQVSPNISTPGVYNLTVTDNSNGCTHSDVTTINQDILPPVANAGADQTLTCAQTNVTLSSAGSSNGATFTISWSGSGIDMTNENAASPQVSVSDIYQLQITNTVNGCTATDQVQVNQDMNLPTANAGADQFITCSVPAPTLDASGSSAGATVTWSGPGINANNQNQLMPVVTVDGQYTLTVVNSLTGCFATDNVQVVLDNDLPVITTTGGTITCQDLQVTMSVSSSLPNSTFLWSGPGISAQIQNLSNPTVEYPGTYNVTVTAPNGCFDEQDVIVAIDSDVPVGAAEGAVLNCTNNGMATISGTISAPPNATAVWKLPNGSTSNALTLDVTQAGTYTFIISSANGCSKTYPVAVTADFAQPAAVATVVDMLNCNTPTVTISGAGSSFGPNFSYDWQPSGGGHIVTGNDGLEPVVDLPDTYTLLVTNTANGCTNTATATVQNDPAVPTAFDLIVNDIPCFGQTNGSIVLNGVTGGTQPFQYTLTNATGTVLTQYNNLSSGAYTLTLNDANGCELDTLLTITEPGELSVALGSDVILQQGESVSVEATIVNSTPLESIIWNPLPPCDSTCLSYVDTPKTSYLQVITVRDSNGCVVRDEQFIKVKKDRLIYVANAFDPESDDAQNAILMIYGGTGTVRIHSWKIFDRWGEPVFEVKDFLPNDPAHAWDGRVKGDKAVPNVFVWYAEVEFVDGEIELFTGDVTLLRN